jgi:hypothetical protein
MTLVVAACFVALLWGCSTSSESPGGDTAVPAPGENPYVLEVRAPQKATVGQEAEVIVTPRAPFKINVDYPAKLILGDLPAGVAVASQTITKADMNVEKTRLLVPVRFTADGPGEKALAGELRFSVCDETTCQMPREPVRWTTVAEAATP